MWLNLLARADDPRTGSCQRPLGVIPPITMADPSPEQSAAAWTVLRLLNWTREYFEAHHVDDPRLSAEVLLGHCLGCRRIDLYTRHDRRPSSEQLTAYRQLVRRAVEHEPVAYLVGEKEFYSLRFKVTPDVLIPRPETELLVGEAVEHLRTLDGAGTVWDACTGSGCIAVAVAVQVDSAAVLATDISPEAVAVAAENAEAHRVGARVRCCMADLLDSPDAAADLAPFDVITANPPYVAEGDEVGETVKHEPRSALYAGDDGLVCIRRIIRDAPDRLVPGGILAMEFGYGQATEVRELIFARRAFDEPRILRDHQGIERAAVARRRK